MQMGAPIENPTESLRARLWRRAAVLSGHTEGGTRIIAAILREEPKLERMSETRLDQRIVQLARQWRREEPALAMKDALPAFAEGTAAGTLAEQLDGVSAGLRETWLMCQGFGIEPASVALVLNESTSAIEARLREVSDELSADGAPLSRESVDTMRQSICALTLNDSHNKALDAAYTVGIARRKRGSLLWIIALILITIGLALILRDLMGWDESQAEREQMIREQSNLLPSDATGSTDVPVESSTP